LQLNNNSWITVSYKQCRAAQNETEPKTKHSKESEPWFNQRSTSNCYTALREEESEGQHHKTGPENTPSLTLSHHLLNVLLQIANKSGLLKKNAGGSHITPPPQFF
jgi:hypothetical protein